MNDKNYFANVLEFLRLESEAIARSATRLNPDDIEHIVDLLAGIKGKIVMLGVVTDRRLGASEVADVGNAAYQ